MERRPRRSLPSLPRVHRDEYKSSAISQDKALWRCVSVSQSRPRVVRHHTSSPQFPEASALRALHYDQDLLLAS